MDKKINISERLIMIASLVPKCEIVADIGTDHALLPIYLINQTVCNKVIAGDVCKGPIKAANKNITYYEMQDYIETRMGSGLNIINNEKVDCVIMAGMGGPLICQLLEEEKNKVHNIKTLILQPNTAHYEVRKYLSDNGFIIDDEKTLKDGAHVYLGIKCHFTGENIEKKDIEFHTGWKLQEKSEGEIYFKNLWRKTKKIVDGMKDSKDMMREDIKKYNEQKELLNYLEELI